MAFVTGGAPLGCQVARKVVYNAACGVRDVDGVVYQGPVRFCVPFVDDGRLRGEKKEQD